MRGGVAPVNAAATPAMSRTDADRELRRLRAEADRIAAALVELDDHPGRHFLEGTSPAGTTLARWTTAQTAMATLWDRFARYREVVDQAGRTTDLVELTGLLGGRSVELPAEQVPLDQRGLTGAAQRVPQVSLDELVTAMTADHREVAAILTAAERVWSAYVPWLDRMDERLRVTKASGLGGPDLTRIGDELATLRRLVFTDPLSLPADDPRIPLLTGEIDAVQREIDTLVRVRDSLGTELDTVGRALDELAAAEERARVVVAAAEAKIATCTLPLAVASVAVLRRRLDQLSTTGDLRQLASALDQIRSSTRTALTVADRARENAQALLDRRAELRGRLDAYRVKAARLQRSEDAELTALHRRAHDLLWHAPCDLAAATSAVLAYQRAITDKGAAR